MNVPKPRDDLSALAGYHSPQVDVEVRLNTNEAPEAPPIEFSNAVAEAVRKVQWHRYPDRSAGELRSGIAKLHAVGAEQIFAANGSNEVLQTILLSYAGAGRKVLTFEPTYALHTHIARIVGATVVSGQRDEQFGIDPGEAAQMVKQHQPSVTFLCSPNNPTGIVDDPSVVSAVLNEVSAYGGLLVVDEAYGQFAPHSALELLDGNPSLVVTRTYSKTWAMAGARLGYLVGDPRIVDQLEKVVLPYHLDSATQAAGIAALEFIDDMDDRVNTIIGQRTIVEQGLADLGCTVWPSGANFVLFRPPEQNGDQVWSELVDRSVLVRNTASWPRLTGSLRVTIGTEPDNARFLDAMSDILRGS